MVGYQIIQGESPEELEGKVYSLLHEGYLPTGGVTVVQCERLIPAVYAAAAPGAMETEHYYVFYQAVYSVHNEPHWLLRNG